MPRKLCLLILGACLGACATGASSRKPPRAPSDFPDAVLVHNLDEVLDANPLPEGENVRVTTLQSREAVSAHLIQVRGRVPLHTHRWSDENIYVLEGKGLLKIDSETFSIREGDVIHVPKGARHEFENRGKLPAVVLSLYTPAFRKGDRRFIK